MEIFYKDVTLKPWMMEYSSGLASIINNSNITDNLRDGVPSPYTEADAVNWIAMTVKVNDPPRFFAIFFSDLLSGSIGLVRKDDVYRMNMEVGYFLAEDLWGKGIMTKAITAAVTYAFSSFDIVRVYAEVFADNPGSRRALEKSGFSCEAVLKKNIIKKGIIKDSCIYSVLRENFRLAGITVTN